jgi:FkbM family methyltransferase
VKILFVMRHSGYLRNFESTLRMLCDRGHTVLLGFQIGQTHWLLDAGDAAQGLANVYPHFSRDTIPVRDDAWGFVGRELRLGLDYLRYLGPEYRDAPKLRERATREVPEVLLRRSQAGLFSTRVGRRMTSALLRGLDRTLPTDPRIDAFLEVNRPDVLALTPLIEPGAPQAEYIRSARALGIKTALCVASWDNLTNKGLIHGQVDLVAVWNEVMKQEAVDLHGVPPERVVVTGAQPFDHWFKWQPSTPGEEFCLKVGLPAHQPYLLYLCSSKFIAPEEVPFVLRWLQQLRHSGSNALREAGVLVRPHPQNAAQWHDVDLSDCGPAVIWPRAGAAPSDATSKADYFDSIYHSAGVVGINTTAEIESAIVGRGVFTLLAPDFRETQGGTLHFEHLRRVNGGLLHVAESVPEHLDQLDAAIRNPAAGDGRCRRFVEAFIRPHGVDVPATPRLVDALEALARAPATTRERAPLWAPIGRGLLAARGERLRREALLAREAKALRARHKAKREALSHLKSSASAESGQSAEPSKAEPGKKGLRTWRELAEGFRGLDYEDRVRFGQATADKLPGELLLETARPERLDYPDADIVLRVISKKERERLHSCAKEPFTIDWLHQWVRAGDVLYDIGANVGAYSLVAAKKPGGGARVFAFEPSYANVSSLCANIVLNGAADQITPLPFALSNANGMTVFGLRALEPGSARHTLGDVESTEGPTLYRQPVVTYRLDDLVERFGLPQPTHVKLDVDGGELGVLAGAARTLASPMLRSMLIEVSTVLSEEITALLAGHGLKLDAKVNVRNKAGEYRVWYGLFARDGQGNSPDRELRVQTVSR